MRTQLLMARVPSVNADPTKPWVGCTARGKLLAESELA